MFTKPCARPGCAGLVKERLASRLKYRTYCCWRCVQWAAVQSRLRGSKDVQRSVRLIQIALKLDGEPPRELVRAVQRIRAMAYRAGWTVVKRKVQRAVKRGVLVRRFKPWENVS